MAVWQEYRKHTTFQTPRVRVRVGCGSVDPHGPVGWVVPVRTVVRVLIVGPPMVVFAGHNAAVSEARSLRCEIGLTGLPE